MVGTIDPAFWKKMRVFVTGHTGFKGAWLSLWLHSMGAKVTGYSLRPPTKPSLFDLARCRQLVNSILGDVRNQKRLFRAVADARPEIIIHMAAQPLVRTSYKDPVETYFINVMGTVHLLDTVRKSAGVRAVVNVTSDKCYENREWIWGYREEDRLGGYDAYSTSKACSELVTTSYRRAFFQSQRKGGHSVALASARAGNVIGGGDWATDRLIPDCIRSFSKGRKVIIRNPKATRPWQHVLEPLSGYLMLAERLYKSGEAYAEGWNFAPSDEGMKPVQWIVSRLCRLWGSGASYELKQQAGHLHEAGVLKLDSSKAIAKLGWRPRWNLENALDKVVEWTRGVNEGRDPRTLCLRQIEEYVNAAK